MSASRIAIFLVVVLSIWTLMHIYVLWRLVSLSWIAGHISRPQLLVAGVGLWLSYPVARFCDWKGWDHVGFPLEWLGTIWMGVLFLLLAFFFAADVVTLGGFLFRPAVPAIRAGAAVIAIVLALIALIQGVSPPVLRDYEVHLPGLPQERDGMTVVQLTDLHLGTLLAGRWLERITRRVNEMKPDLVVIVGDLIDGNALRVQPLVPPLRHLNPPLGVWAVTGNHEYYAGIERSLAVFEQAGLRVLRDSNAVVTSGLVLAGVDDLTARREFAAETPVLAKALQARGPGATILLSHSPLHAKQAASLGAGLMLCGHTHNGQVWPFNYLVRLRYELLGGRYDVDGMTVIVSRGAGTWGPPMRLWYRSEMVRITLRSAAPV